MHNGRNFEYLSGEDPVLGSALLPRLVDGVQQNAMAIVKHYIGNTQETDRTTVNELVPEKLLMELYGPPFAAAVQRSAGVMCASVLLATHETFIWRRPGVWAGALALAPLTDPRPHSLLPLTPRFQLQPGERSLCMREPLHAEDDAQGPLQLFRVCRLRLGRLPQHDAQPAGGPRHRDAKR